MTRITEEHVIERKGKWPHEENIRCGVDFTLSLCRDEFTNEQALLVGIIDQAGMETAIPMGREAVIKIAGEMLKIAEKMR